MMIGSFDRKECFMLKVYCNRISTHSFDETDVVAFLILIREHLDDKYKYIKDIADLVAHRQRDKGLTSAAISGAIANNYATKTKSNAVRGYHGIEPDKWKKEWEELSVECGFTIDQQSLLEISLCVMSLLQFSIHADKEGHKATVFLFQSDDGQLSACTLEVGKTQPYITYFVWNGLNFIKRYSAGIIDDPVIVVRNEYGEAILQNNEGERIV